MLIRSLAAGWKRPTLRVAALAAGLGLVVTGCSNGSGDSSSTSATSKQGSADNSAAVTKAKAAVEKAVMAPTQIPVSEKLSKKPDHQTMVFLQCELPQCTDIGSGIQSAAEALGWTYKSIAWNTGDTTTFTSAMKQALQYHPYAVSFSGEPESVWSGVLPLYESAGVKLIPISMGPLSKTSDTVPANIADFTTQGVAVADYFIADSQGSGHALVFDVPAFPVLTEGADGIRNEIKATCPDCSVTSLDGTVTQLGAGQIPAAIVTALKKDPSIKYVLSSDLALNAGLTSALKSAGLSGIKIGGVDPGPSDLQAVKDGSEIVAAVASNQIFGWMAVDTAARLSVGMPVAADGGGTLFQLLTQDNITSTKLEDYSLPKDYAAQYKALWNVTS